MERLAAGPLPSTPPGTISVVSYNLLAPCYVRVPGQFWNAYPYCQDEWLDWETRQRGLLAEILALNADVICLQEVVFEEADEQWGLPKWAESLPAAGYVGALPQWKPKEWDSLARRNLRVLGARVTTGVAVFYRAAKFAPVRAPQTASRGLTVFLAEHDAAARQYAIVNLHLEGNASDPEQAEKQVAQMRSALGKLPGAFRCAVICGDFNAECLPGSELVQYLARQDHVVLQEAPTGATWAEPGKAMRLDHLFFTPLTLRLGAVLDKMTDAIAAAGLPSADCHSDHLPIAAVLHCLP